MAGTRARSKMGRRPSSETVMGFSFFSLLVTRVYLEYVRPADMYGFLSPLKLGGIFMLICTMIWLFKCEKSALNDSTVKYTLALLAMMAAWVPFARNNHDAFSELQTILIFMMSITLPFIAIVNSPEKIRRYFFHWVILNSIVGLIVLKNGGRGTGSFLFDENDVGLNCAVALPYAAYQVFDRSNSKQRKLFFILAAVFIAFAGAYSRSRGAFIGLISVGFVMWIFSQNRFKKLMLSLLFALLAGGIVLALLPPGYMKDMESANDPNDSTRVERLYSWKVAWQMFVNNPIAGIGPGNFPWNAGIYEKLVPKPKGQAPIAGRASHSLYFTMIPELGSIGCGLIIATWITMFIRLRKVVKKSELPDASDDEHYFGLLAKALVASMAGYLTSGAFITVLYYPHQWVAIGYCAAIYYQVFGRPWLTQRRRKVPV
jgi:O-antigen ligase